MRQRYYNRALEKYEINRTLDKLGAVLVFFIKLKLVNKLTIFIKTIHVQ